MPPAESDLQEILDLQTELATLLTGFLVLIGAAAAGSEARTYEAAMLKTLGASRRRCAIPR